MNARARRFVAALLLAAALSPLACTPADRGPSPAALDAAAERYVKLVLALGRHDPNYVDAFYGPPQWKAEADRDSIPLAAIRREADSLVAALGDTPAKSADSLWALRHRYVRRQLEALSFHSRRLAGEKLSFDQESQALSDVVAPPIDEAALAPALARLDSLLPGKGPLAERLDRYQKAFVIPTSKLDAVFRAAIEEARRRTKLHLALPDSESFVLEFITNQPWGGYNWYQGGLKSLIQVNTDLPIYIDRALDLACHEGYPGHHVYNLLLEKALVRDRGWQEFAVYPLYSPQSMIAEGTAVVATEVVFPGEERARFEKSVVFPLAGLDTLQYERYAAVRRTLAQFRGVTTQIDRRWLDGEITREQAIEESMRLNLRTRERATKDLNFAERYRSYVVNYWMGRKVVEDWLEANGGDEAHPERRWALYQTLLASPRLPADLVPEAVAAR